MKKRYLLGALAFLLTFNLSAQDDDVDPNCGEPDKKTIKYIDEARSGSNLEETVGSFIKAMERSPDNAMAYYQYALWAYNKGNDYYESEPYPAKGDRSFQTAKEMFQKTIERCPDYHAGMYYYAGVICFTQEKKEEAKGFFQSFLEYKNIDNDRFPNDYMKMVRDVKGVLKEWEEVEKFESITVPFEPFKVENVSTTTDEYFPMISPDNELMFYTRKVDRTRLGEMIKDIREEYTFSQRSSVFEPFDKGTPFAAPFNDGSFTSYGAATMSVDNKEMIMCACKKANVRGQDYLNCDLYVTTYFRSGKGGNDFTWTPLESLGSNINTSDGWEGQPSLSPDGNTLYFTSVRKGSRDNDIYISEKQKDGSWGLALPFDHVNTAGKDKSPFIHQDNETFYFVSTSTDTRRGAGGLDIFYCKRTEEGWSKPVNIGMPINTETDELGLFVSTDGEIAYYSSRQKSGWDIFGFELYVEARPTGVAILKGTLESEDGEPIVGAEIEVSYGDEVQTFKVNGDDGRYAAVIKLDKGTDIAVSVKKEGVAFSSQIIEKSQIEALKERKEVALTGKDLLIQPLKEGSSYEIADIRFATSSDVLTERSKLMLNEFARYLTFNKILQFEIRGHTDNVGDDSENLDLSKSRALSVKNYLIEQGIESKRLSSAGFGASKPKVENDSEANRAINRRTEFRIEKL
ncbi:MAG: outer membrane protein OmpA-like peptidoglycan-associated protein [Lentimonas sp.]|jgi:outer membrane protein OmpA-like peptidoglycan-associated protein